MIIVALALGIAGGGTVGADSTQNPTTGVLPPITTSAPPNATAQAGPCTQMLEQLPVQLKVGKRSLAPRVVHTTPDTPYVVAWGDPAIVLACGTAKPEDLVPGSDKDLIDGGSLDGPWYDVTSSGDTAIYTAVDRAPFISISIPGAYQADGPLTELSTIIRNALPAVCTVPPAGTPDTYCTRRT